MFVMSVPGATAINIVLFTVSITPVTAGDAAIAEADSGNGLRNIRSRVTSLGGKLELITAPGKGTEVNVEFFN